MKMTGRKMSEAEKNRYDKINRLTNLLCGKSGSLAGAMAEQAELGQFKVGRRITVNNELISIKNRTYESRQIQKVTINTEGSMGIYDRYGKKLCGSISLNLSSANIELFCLWVRKQGIPAEVVSGDGERVFQLICLFFPSLVIVLIKILKYFYKI